MVYLIAALGVAVVTSLLVMLYGVSRIKDLSESDLEAPPAGLKRSMENTEALVSDLSRRVAEIEQGFPVIRAEVAEALTRVDSRFNAARAAEERTRRIARNAAEEEEDGATLSEEEFLALTAQSRAQEAQQDSHQLAWPDLEQIAFERRNQGRR